MKEENKKYILFRTADGCEKYSALIAHEKHPDILVPIFRDLTLQFHYGTLNEEPPLDIKSAGTRRYKSTYQQTVSNDGLVYIIYSEFVE